MCYNVSLIRKRGYLEKRFDARFAEPELYRPIYHASAFTTPMWPVICDKDAGEIRFLQWGLIPSWVKDEASAEKLRFKTFNARSETIFEKPSFRGVILKKRCLILVDGFFEWHEHKGRKYPHYIRLTSGEAFALAGIWDSWLNRATGEILSTFSIITTEANPLLEKIHNTKKRMPVVLPSDKEKAWLEADLERDEIASLLVPLDERAMEAWPVSKLITTRGADKNVPDVIERFDYDELDTADL
jgi:putative SOS response-associated peptidase YedK